MAEIQRTGRIFLWLPVMIALGIGVYFLQENEPSGRALMIIGLSGLALMAIGYMFREALIALPLAAIAWIGAGYLAAGVHTIIAGTPVLEFRVTETAISGIIRDVEIVPARGWKAVIDIERIEQLSLGKTPRRVRLTWPARLKPPEIGAIVHLTARLWPLPRPVAPGAFDYGRKMFFLGIGAFGQVKSIAEMTPGAGGWRDGILRFRRHLASDIAARIGGQAGAVAAALVTGDRSRISAETKSDLRAAGLAHLLAISGLHMGLAVGAVFFGVRALFALFPPIVLRYPIKKWAAGLALVAGAMYLVMSGASIPTVRAFIMAAIALSAILVDRQAISLRTVAIAATIILLVQPDSLVQAGFQLSFAAVVALVSIYELWGRRTFPGHWARQDPVARSGSAIFGIGMTSLIAGLATAPFAAAHFNRITAFGLLGNLAAMPVMALIIMPGAVIASLLWPLGLSQPAWYVMGAGIQFVLDISHWIAQLPGAETLIATPPGWTLPVFAMGGLIIAIQRYPWLRIAGVGLALAGLTGFLVPDRPDILVGKWGRTVAIRTSSGDLFLTGRQPNSYDAQQWLRRDGSRTGEAGADPCSGTGTCMMSAAPGVMTIATDGDDIARLCREARIVIVPFRSAAACPETLVLDSGDFSRNGNVAIDAKTLDVTSVAGARGKRPWVSPRYWRK